MYKGHRQHDHSSKNILRRSRPMVQTGMVQVQPPWEKQFGGSRDSLEYATQLHQSIVASELPVPVYISQTMGYLLRVSPELQTHGAATGARTFKPMASSPALQVVSRGLKLHHLWRSRHQNVLVPMTAQIQCATIRRT